MSRFRCHSIPGRGSLALPRFLCALLAAPGVIAAVATAEDSLVMLPDVIVVGERRPADTPGSRSWDADEIAAADRLTLDQVLAQDPAFSLYRRQSAAFGNPTSAGVSLRRTGATATSRTLVLRDGIPQNDPFGSWLSWTRYDAAALDSLRIVPPAGATIWGNQSAAGTVHITSRTPERTGAQLRSSLGNHGTWAFSAAGDVVAGDGSSSVQANVYTLQSDGFHVVPGSQRGAIDRRLDLDVRGADLRSVWSPEEALTLEATLGLFEEERGNGTALSRNATDAADASMRATWETDGWTLQALGYYQHRDFSALFASASANRSSESPALDQFDVPGTGAGGGITAAWRPLDGVAITVGADARQLRGETNEDAGFVNGAFLRRRQAGGRETFAGAFARASLEPGTGPRVELSGRLDYWTLTHGRRIETRPATGALLRGDTYPDRDGFEPSLGLTVQQDAGETLTFSASASASFRAPTLNELYRPFRVRDDITEANPSLDPERFLSLDTGFSWSPSEHLDVSNTFFVHWIDDAIANVPVTDPATAGALGVFVPAGGSLQQRDNVDQARVIGLESRATWSPAGPFSLSAFYQLTETEFVDSGSQPLLAGQPFPQSPRHQAGADIAFRPAEWLELSAGASFSGEAFDDAVATRPLDAYWNTTAGVSIKVNDHLTLRAHADNLLDEEIETGLSSDGLLTTGAPRSYWLSLSLQF